MTSYNTHKPVLLQEVLSFLPKKKLVYLDLTLGRAGHADAILSRLGEKSVFYGVDMDPDALAFSCEKLAKYSKKISLHYLHSSYAEAIPSLKSSGMSGADFILMDIGVSSPQFDDPERGFSYRFDAPLDMRMDPKNELTAKAIVNTYSPKDLTRVFQDLGEAKIVRPVVSRILEERTKKPIETTFELVDIIKSSLPERELRKKGHPAKQYFLGLRYEVNGEIEQLKKGSREAADFLLPGGRLAIISFNSEEDRIVKNLFREKSKVDSGDKYHPMLNVGKANYLELTKKPITADDQELEDNNRAKSAILRVLERRESK
ncbi:MAG: 16S rRNA (cytosine(1402)-N(4))-methyltransferase RsmH [Bacilli bacterium]